MTSRKVIVARRRGRRFVTIQRRVGKNWKRESTLEVSPTDVQDSVEQTHAELRRLGHHDDGA